MLFIIILLLFSIISFKKELFNTQHPNKLIFQKNKYWLINTQKKFEIGKNPIIFDSINDYKHYNNNNNYTLLKPSKEEIPEFILNMFLLKDKKKRKSKKRNKNSTNKTYHEESIENINKNNQIQEEINQTQEEINQSHGEINQSHEVINQSHEENNPSHEENNMKIAEMVEENNEKKISTELPNIDKTLPFQKQTKYYRQPNKKFFSNYGFDYMPATSWSVPQQRPPPCIPQERCPVCPVVDKGTPVDAIEWSQVGSILPKFEYKEVYNKNYYYPGWIAGDNKLSQTYPKYKMNYSMQQPFNSTKK